jgi:hypothetical protein
MFRLESADCRYPWPRAFSAPASQGRKLRSLAPLTRSRRMWMPRKSGRPVRWLSTRKSIRDRCHSGEGARLQAALKDGNELVSRGRLAMQKS